MVKKFNEYSCGNRRKILWLRATSCATKKWGDCSKLDDYINYFQKRLNKLGYRIDTMKLQILRYEVQKIGIKEKKIMIAFPFSSKVIHIFLSSYLPNLTVDILEDYIGATFEHFHRESESFTITIPIIFTEDPTNEIVNFINHQDFQYMMKGMAIPALVDIKTDNRYIINKAPFKGSMFYNKFLPEIKEIIRK